MKDLVHHLRSRLRTEGRYGWVELLTLVHRLLRPLRYALWSEFGWQWRIILDWFKKPTSPRLTADDWKALDDQVRKAAQHRLRVWNDLFSGKPPPPRELKSWLSSA